MSLPLVVQGSKKPSTDRVKLKILEIFNNLFQISVSDINIWAFLRHSDESKGPNKLWHLKCKNILSKIV